jgi:hypothetical protein
LRSYGVLDEPQGCKERRRVAHLEADEAIADASRELERGSQRCVQRAAGVERQGDAAATRGERVEELRRLLALDDRCEAAAVEHGSDERVELAGVEHRVDPAALGSLSCVRRRPVQCSRSGLRSHTNRISRFDWFRASGPDRLLLVMPVR